MLEQELHEKDDETEPMTQKIKYLTNLIEQKDKELMLLKLDYEQMA